jgi:hypothetical protein
VAACVMKGVFFRLGRYEIADRMLRLLKSRIEEEENKQPFIFLHLYENGNALVPLCGSPGACCIDAWGKVTHSDRL